MLKPNKYPKVVTTAAASLLLMGAGALVNSNVHADEVQNNVPTAQTVQNNGKVIQKINEYTSTSNAANEVPYSIDSSKINATQANISNHLADQKGITAVFERGWDGIVIDSSHNVAKDFNYNHEDKPLDNEGKNFEDTYYITDVYGNRIDKNVIQNNNNKIAKELGLHFEVRPSMEKDKPNDGFEVVDKNGKNDFGANVPNNQILEHGKDGTSLWGYEFQGRFPGDDDGNGWEKNYYNLASYHIQDFMGNEIDPSQAKDHYYSDTINNTVPNNTSAAASNKSVSINGNTSAVANSSSAIKAGNVISSNTNVSANTIATNNGYHVSNNGQAVIDKNGNIVSGWTVAANGQMVSPEGQMITAKAMNNKAASSQPAMSQLSNNTVANAVKSSESNNIVASKANNSTVSNSNSNATKESTSNAKSSANSAKLPQTNESNSNAAVAAGLGLLSLTGLFGLGYRRRH